MSDNCPKCGGQDVKKNGFYSSLGEKVQKYVCKICGKDFTSRSKDSTFGEHRPELNDQIKALYLTGYGAKAIAEMLNCSKRTVQVKVKKYVK